MGFKRNLIAVTVAVLLAACGAQGKYYEQSPKDIRMALRTATLPYHILGSSAAGSRVSQPDDNTMITAIIAQNGSELARFAAIITPDGEGSRVQVEVRPPEGNNKARAEKALAGNAYASGLLQKLAEEHVAAAIEKRPFDMMFATGGMAKGMINSNPELRAHVEEANAAAAEMNQAAQDGGFSSDAEVSPSDY